MPATKRQSRPSHDTPEMLQLLPYPQQVTRLPGKIELGPPEAKLDGKASPTEQVAIQSLRIAAEQQSRREAAVEFQATLRERNRLAGNLHDTVLQTVIGQNFFGGQGPFQFGGTALLIVVGVALDTVQQIEGHLITRHYEGFTGPRGPRIRGRRLATGQAVNA